MRDPGRWSQGREDRRCRRAERIHRPGRALLPWCGRGGIRRICSLCGVPCHSQWKDREAFPLQERL